ncbi:unnamed protein product [Plasmodium vivax]|uniref:(malaria parasite P. vivax) hypothetical protein n=1 Tax=Plasmodium vivax TaxID=5855 RepID=A0A8S4H473_PLAVI|nr:unnamed protein product [Plasmodium vivax]
MTTTGKEEWEEILKGSASYDMYKNFDVEVKPKEDGKDGKQGAGGRQEGAGGRQEGANGRQEEANGKQVGKEKEPDHCEKIKNIESKYKDEAYNLCRKMEKSLEYLKGIEVGGTRRYSCVHYKYWMSYKLLSMLKKASENVPDKTVLEEFSNIQKIFVENNNDYGCIYDYKDVSMKYLEEMNEEKYLYDYFKNYNTVKEYIKREPSKMEIYKKYLEHISKIYDKYKKVCSDGFDYWASKCPLYFKREDEYDPKKLCAQLKSPCLNNRDDQSKEVKEDPGISPKKKKMTFYYLRCKNELKDGHYRRCALIPSTMEYTENKDKSKINDGEEEEEIPVSPDPAIVLGGILKNREQTTGPKTVPGKPGSHGSSQIGPSASRNDQFNSQYLTEADGISPYLVQTEDGIKWKIDDDETLDCKNYGSGDTYGLCKRLEELHKEGIFKLNPNPSRRKARIKRPSFERGDGLSDEGSYQTDEDDAYSSNTWDDMFSLLKTKQFRTGTTIVLIILLLDHSLGEKKEGEQILTMNILKENRKSYLDVANNR